MRIGKEKNRRKPHVTCQKTKQWGSLIGNRTGKGFRRKPNVGVIARIEVKRVSFPHQKVRVHRRIRSQRDTERDRYLSMCEIKRNEA